MNGKEALVSSLGVQLRRLDFKKRGQSGDKAGGKYRSQDGCLSGVTPDSISAACQKGK